MTINQQIQVTTDAQGSYQLSQTYNPPGFWDITVAVTVQLVAPTAAHVVGTYTAAAVDGSIQNPSKDFEARTGDVVDLGSTKLSSGDNLITVEGKTDPALPNTQLQFEISATL